MAKRALACAVAAAVLVLPVACSSGGPGSQESPDSSTTSASPRAATTGEATAQVDHSVPAPGPRTAGLVAPADFLVVLPDTASDETVAAVEGVKGVSGVTVISLSESVIENRALTVAAVDPATYRSFTPATDSGADFQVAWDRVAGGEVALKKRLQGRLPLDSDDFLRLGSADDAPRVHVGAYVDQQPLIDAVVNETWIDTLGMKRDNAMLVRTGGTAPDRVQDRLTDVLGKDAAVTPVDKASRIGLDPNTAQVAVVTGTVADAVGVFRYTVIGGGRIAPEPAWVSSHISTEAVPILGSMTCNTLMFPQLKAALQEIVDRGLASEIHPDEYAGCYYPRFIAGSTTLSNHSFGLAFDINVPGNGRGTVGAINRDVVQIFKDWGFDWGGDWSYTDPMHFEMAQIVTPGGAAARSD
ncbi:M15 family peptidase [Nocardioides sp. YIM 123512]|uniref:M15 family peptidase n=1 Tax=Nocardioides flavescens TaxID=2691959 RepID=A0A6L7F213_9ACTN|nr:M15 family peptidase [Nocardioides flavescens]